MSFFKNTLVITVLIFNTKTFSADNLIYESDKDSQFERIVAKTSSEKRFEKFFSMKSVMFKGRSQNFSLYNLDLEMRIHYIRPVNSEMPYEFTLASNGNLSIYREPVFPTEGIVKFEIKDSSGKIKEFKYRGEKITFDNHPNIMYLVETEEGLMKRRARLYERQVKLKNNIYDKAHGLLIGVVSFDLFEQNIRFFQIDQMTNELVPRGTFTGRSSVR
jgi:hypothetical protein